MKRKKLVAPTTVYASVHSHAGRVYINPQDVERITTGTHSLFEYKLVGPVRLSVKVTRAVKRA